MLVGSKVHIQLICSTLPTYRLSCSLLVSNLYFISQLLYRRYSGNFHVNLLGIWKESEYSGQSVPVGGIAYYITAPSSLADMAAHPFHALFYIVFMLSACALFFSSYDLIPAHVNEIMQEGIKSAGVESLHTHSSRLWWDVYWSTHCVGRFYGGNCVAYWDITGCDYHLPVLRDIRKGEGQ